jgi:hypothetical protein
MPAEMPGTIAGRDARHDAERDAGLDQGQGLLATAAEDEGVAAFEPQDPPAVARQLDQTARDVGLLGRGLAAALAGEVELGAGARERQHPLAHQGVVDHHVGLAERVVRGGRPASAGRDRRARRRPARPSRARDRAAREPSMIS